ncbi:DUF5666 domain-containing protein [Nitrosomonas sp. Nm166]|uniref:DUF5666 domain-containing protein n=1 Tax=Nitrosomonas sp. Nm166 TaxID=1881054 RepID=UPI0008E2EFE4|nr:DUF5666 domain-containing protein [Nitrosomonas sp. Nm166]SFE69581.1 hypothetical protein SAMN05428977_102610 [Nitrosomonas sp. Nm166]
MTKISLTALYHINRYILGIMTLMLTCSVDALAKNNCNSNASSINPYIATNSGIGGTGGPQLEMGGVGGTGNTEGGIGGTGIEAKDGGIGGTGIIGIITGFASICVNDVEIHYDASTPVSVDGQPFTIHDLAVGQVIAARAVGAGHEFTARNIAVFHAAVGPISDLDPGTGELYVLAQTVQVRQSQDQDNFSRLKAGDWVQISGHRLAGNVIIASRIDSISPLEEARIKGHVTRVDANGFEVNGTRIINHDLPINIMQGMEVLVVGRWDGAYLEAQYVQTEPTRQSIGDVEHVIMEGYIHALNDEEFNLNGHMVTLDSNAQIEGNARGDLKQDQLLQLSGRLDADQRIVAEHIELKKEFPVQFHESDHTGQTDSDGEDKKHHAENELEIKSTDESESSPAAVIVM